MALSYVLSQQADHDIADIFDYTEFEYGLEQAVIYTAEFSRVFIKLTQDPELGRRRDEIKSGLRSLVHNKHVVFYRILDAHIRIVRVLHGRSDIPRFLE